MINGLDLFSGIGGISLALSPWVRTVCYVEIDRYCQAVLMSRMRSGDLEHAPIWDDIQTFDPGPWIGKVDIVSGGFPCQDISTAGKGAGLEGKRSGLFFEIVRLSSIIQPAFIFLENVPAILTRGGGTVISEIASLGYDTRWGILSAYDVGAPHLRERFWLLAHANNPGYQRKGEFYNDRKQPAPMQGRSNSFDFTSNDGGTRDITGSSERQITPRVDTTGNDIPERVDKLKGLGNSVVPACAREAFQRLMGITI